MQFCELFGLFFKDDVKILIEKKSLKIAVKEGYISLLELQLPGKRRMQVNEVLNGLNLENDAYLR